MTLAGPATSSKRRVADAVAVHKLFLLDCSWAVFSSGLLHVASQACTIGRWAAVVVCMTQPTVDLI